MFFIIEFLVDVAVIITIVISAISVFNLYIHNKENGFEGCTFQNFMTEFNVLFNKFFSLAIKLIFKLFGKSSK